MGPLERAGRHWLTDGRTGRSDETAAPANVQVLALLAALSKHTNFSVGCYCEDESHCHRSALRALLVENGADVAR